MGIFGAKERDFFTKAQTDGTRFVLNNRQEIFGRDFTRIRTSVDEDTRVFLKTQKIVLDFIFPEEKFSPRKNFGKDFEEISSVINALRASIIRLPPSQTLARICFGCEKSFRILREYATFDS